MSMTSVLTMRRDWAPFWTLVAVILLLMIYGCYTLHSAAETVTVAWENSDFCVTVVEASTNLVDWDVVYKTMPSYGTVEIILSNRPPFEFYRAANYWP